MLDKIECVKKFPTPTNSRKFDPHYDDKARPLVNLTKKKEPKIVKRTPECEHAFNGLKAHLTAAPI